jgi:hypothetical protein
VCRCAGAHCPSVGGERAGVFALARSPLSLLAYRRRAPSCPFCLSITRAGTSLPSLLARPLVSKFWWTGRRQLCRNIETHTRHAFPWSPPALLAHKSVCEERHVRQSQTWRTRQTDRTGKAKRRRRILADQIPKLLHMQRQDDWPSRVRALKMYVRFPSLQASVLTATGQREAPPRPARRPPPGGSTPNHRRCRRSLWRWQNNTHQELDQALYQADPLFAVGTPHCRHLEAPPPHVHRMPFRLAREHDRYCQGGGHLPAHD